MRAMPTLIACAACMMPVPATADSDNLTGSRNVRFEVDFDFFDGSPNIIVASGAFEDNGTIQHDIIRVFHGSVGFVTDSPQFIQGPITWELKNAFTEGVQGPAHNGEKAFRQTWDIIGGTGRYEGITGSGTSQGTWNAITGSLRSVGYGSVVRPKC